MEDTLVSEAISEKPVKVEVVNFESDSVLDNAVKVVIAGVAVTLATELTKSVIGAIKTKRAERKMLKEAEANLKTNK